ncbi:MAG: hypothetical protein SOU19_00460 [Candidatus Caccosoma sp.]|nr:hypothetical protein [Candidatus Caccosoma sp.]
MKRLRKTLTSFLIILLGILFINLKSNKVFALSQGENNFYYFYGEANGKYYQMTYNEDTTRFEFTNEPYAMINESSSHPGVNGDVIKAYRANANIILSMKISLIHEASEGDGVIVKFGRRNIKEDGNYSDYISVLDDYFLKQENIQINLKDINLNRGDLLFISINKNKTDANDSTTLITNVTYEKIDDGIDYGNNLGDSRIIDASKYYSSIQGTNDYFYAYGFNDKYVLMEFGNCNDGSMAYHGPYPYLQIGIDYMHPADRYNTLKIFVCRYDGIISIEGFIKHQNVYGDGINFKILKNEEIIYNNDILGTDDKRYELDSLLSINVKAGDLIIMSLNSGKHYDNSSDALSTNIDIYYKTKGNNEIDKEAINYLNLVSKEADLFDVIKVDKDYDKEANANGCKANASQGIIATFVILALLLFLKNKKKKYLLSLMLIFTICSCNNQSIKNEVYDNIIDYANRQNYHNWSYLCGDVENELKMMVYNDLNGKYLDYSGEGKIQKDQWMPSTNNEIMACFTANSTATIKVKITLELLELQNVGSDGVAFYVKASDNSSYILSTTLRNEITSYENEFEYHLKESEKMYFIMSAIMSTTNDRTYVHISISYK